MILPKGWKNTTVFSIEIHPKIGLQGEKDKRYGRISGEGKVSNDNKISASIK
jgi:hypothetical protein